MTSAHFRFLSILHRLSYSPRPQFMWRTLSRPANIAWRSRHFPRRSIYSTPQAPFLQSRPDGLLAKIRFRKDGQPRSKLVGAAFASLLVLQTLTFMAGADTLEESSMAVAVLAGVIYAQKQDTKYDQVNFDDREENLEYFKSLYTCFTPTPEEELSKMFDTIFELMTHDKDNDLKAEAYEITREAAQQVHEAFQRLGEEDAPVELVANHVFAAMLEATRKLLELVEDIEVDGESRYDFQLIKDHSNKNSKSLKDYESLG